MRSESDSFRDKPESASGFLILGGLIAGVAYLLIIFLLPIISQIVGEPVAYATLITILAAMSAFLFDSRSRSKVSLIYKSLLARISRSFVNKDPVKILDKHLKTLNGDLAKMGKQIGKLRGQIRRLNKQIGQNEAGITENMEEASRAKERSKEAMMKLKARKAGRLRESNEKLKELLERIIKLDTILSNLYDRSEILIDDIKGQIEEVKAEREAILASNEAMRSARNVIRGGEKLDLFNQAMTAIADDLGRKVGEIERFLDISGNFMDNMDVQKELYEDEGLKMLDELEEKSKKLFLSEPEADNLDLNKEQSALDLEHPEKEKLENNQNPYSGFFDEQ